MEKRPASLTFALPAKPSVKYHLRGQTNTIIPLPMDFYRAIYEKKLLAQKSEDDDET